MGERRKYIRISSVLPVEFCLLDEQNKKITPWLQGFTHDIGKGGICLIVNDLWWGFWDKIGRKDAKLFLRINLLFKKKTITANAQVVWATQEKQKDFSRYAIGLKLFTNNKKEAQSLFNYAILNKFTPVVLYCCLAFLLVSAGTFILRAHLLTLENRKLISNYVSILEKSSSLNELLVFEKGKTLSFEKREKNLDTDIAFLEEQIKKYKVDKNYSQQEIEEKITLFKRELSFLRKENELLQNKRKEYKEATSTIEREVRQLEYEKTAMLDKIINGIYSWIKNRQDLMTGLILSYEGDQSLKKISFTYDQALAVIVFVISNDNVRAEKILDFYLRKVERGENIFNAYYTQGDAAEYIVHSGPCAWLGIAVLDYYKQTKNKRYLPIAEKIADFLLTMMDSEGGIKGGPDVDWYATEHNLDAYAFFQSFYELTGNSKYLSASQKIKKWISDYAYTTYGPPVKRGKGDSTIATDTYAWSITAFGPKTLFDLKMNPDRILEFAVENCETQVRFKRKEGEVTVNGFDFAKFRNSPRGGVISCEWTAQMILSFEIMANYYKTKDIAKYKDYLKKSVFYSNELQKMLITSASKIGREDPCLPYASSASVDTGHGWRTPSGDYTGSLSSSAYFIIAYLGYNPLKGEFLEVSLKNLYGKDSGSFTTKTN